MDVENGSGALVSEPASEDVSDASQAYLRCMALTLDDLKPYASFLITAVRDGANKTAIVDQVLDDVRTYVDDSPTRQLLERQANTQSGQLWVAFLTYEEHRNPAWTSSEELTDVTNQLVFIARRDRHVAVYASEPTMGRWIGAQLNRGELTGLSGLRAVHAAVLNTAFARGAARTLWLSGIHRRTSSKADSKVLAGSDLQDALDPIGDQSYHFTSARTQPGLPGLPPKRANRAVGFTPRHSKVWAGSVREFPELRDMTYALLGRIKEAEVEGAQAAPFAVLAAPASSPAELEGPYDVAVVAPELLAGGQMDDPVEAQLAERWAYRSAFDVVPTGAGAMRVEVEVDGNPVGDLDITIDVMPDGSASTEVTPGGGGRDLLEAAGVFRRSSWLSIRFESGHTLSNGMVYSVRHRDMPFDSWRFVDLAGFNVKEEKPPTSANFDPGEIGNHDSLFCWVKNRWPVEEPGRGWLACDDGAGEIADFVHFDIGNPDGPLLSLIHVKASGSVSTGRQISTSDYEVVVGQAVKNLRHLDRLNLADGLEGGAGKTVAVATWADGARRTRTDMANAVRGVGDHYQRRLIVMQPRVTQTELGLARDAIAAGDAGGRAARLRQLDTLLLEAEASARDLGARFEVVADII